MRALQGGAALSAPRTPCWAGVSPSQGRTHLGSICHAFVCRRKKSGDQLILELGDC